jgi:hypothetical protein
MYSTTLYTLMIQPFATYADGYISMYRSEQKKCAESTCNYVDKTNVGVYFEGFGNNINFEGNRFDRHDIGLLLEVNAVIGQQQNFNGNLWTGNTNQDAFHNAGVFSPLANQSLFLINSSTNTFGLNIKPNNYGSLLPWFFDIANPVGPDNFDCNRPQFICGGPLLRVASPNNISTVDNTIANGGLSTVSVTEYNGKRGLFRKLTENPSLALNSTNPNIQNFVANHQSNCIGHFDNVTHQCEQAFALSNADSIVIDSFKNQCICHLDSLHCLDSILAINYNNATANIRNNVANDLSLIMQQQEVFLNNLNTQQQAALVPICNVNSGFSTIVTHELLEKEVNTIYLNTLAKGILSFDNVQLNALRLVASYCPQEGGVAVHQARGMLSMVEDVDLLNFDCNTNNQAKKSETTTTNDDFVANWEVTLYPNPADNLLNIRSNQVLKKGTIIQVYNALGQEMIIVFLDKNHTQLSINTDDLQDGIYFLQITNGEKKETQSFSISKK